jgi:hypothetical protein
MLSTVSEKFPQLFFPLKNQNELSCENLYSGIYGIIEIFSDAGSKFIGNALKRNTATMKALVN